ncbi:MAG: LLM class flavin-dependent oxidoreductase [Acidimicrobiaceae bacterium]|nr:LLM class flavin-dependent oxidoreductase [Acidimicrobiaceae bacterium]MXW60730.1 LLM class flavin-dependent oxidoreductase [Acidimicrobiaceae bacterium]MXW75231.1 LLM class flavin-dependent oxidoreductase [Acidimicrobiaceae bacterium]MYC42350.1 LLM class flavin-dependent oxidoreductase [Acidimicrobiaceae bacterium]MYD06312.1 LLM class flavin-dependent oxidoreductase [Acidimicrobiaceae bacterium]
MDFQLFLPQMRMSLPTMVQRVNVAVDSGFDGVALMDHLAPPLAESQPMWDAMTTAAWLGANTTGTVGHLVLCDSFYHPAVLARQAVTLDHATSGRFELGIGWGSVPTEFETFGVGDTAPRARVDRLTETLEVVTALWSGERVSYCGRHHTLSDAQQVPTTIDRIPIVIGGSGPRTLALVARFADWWNCPIHRLDRFDEMRERIGDARSSIQQRVTFIPHGSDRVAITETALRRFSDTGHVIGDADELIEHFAERAASGIERIYVWMSDFAVPDTVSEFGETVLQPLRLG